MTKFVVDKFTQEIKTNSPFVDFPINGHYIIDVRQGVTIDTTVNPFDVSELISQKFAGLLAGFPEFSDIVFDELEDANDINVAATGHFARLGEFEQLLPPTNGQVTTSVFDLTAVTSLAGAPVKFQPHFDFYAVTRTQTNRGNFNEVYNEVSPSLITTEISFDGGSTFTAATDSTSGLIGVPDTDLVLRFTNTTANEVYIGSWAVLLSDVL